MKATGLLTGAMVVLSACNTDPIKSPTHPEELKNDASTPKLAPLGLACAGDVACAPSASCAEAGDVRPDGHSLPNGLCTADCSVERADDCTRLKEPRGFFTLGSG